MNEKLQYATMLEIPVSTCSVTTKTTKKRKARRKKEVSPEAVKEQLFSKINMQESVSESQVETPEWQQAYDQAINEIKEEENAFNQEVLLDEQTSEQERVVDDQQVDYVDNTVSIVQTEKKKKKRFRFSVIGAQFAVIVVLVATIILTSALNVDSGINVFFRNVFGSTVEQPVDARTYADFAPVISMGDNDGMQVSEGVISVGGEGSIYSPCDGKVTSLTKGADDRYTIEITHSENFKTVLSGIEHAYVGMEDLVYFNIPVGYLSSDGATMCFTQGDGTIICDYQIVDNTVVWAV